MMLRPEAIDSSPGRVGGRRAIHRNPALSRRHRHRLRRENRQLREEREILKKWACAQRRTRVEMKVS